MANDPEQWKLDDEKAGRVIAILDMDAFECQVYLKLRYPKDWIFIFNSQPVALKIEKSSRIISSNHIAKDFGIDRSIKWKTALRIRPDMTLLTKDEEYGKAETKNARKASQEIYQHILNFRSTNNMKFPVEFASADEFYFDLTKDVDALFKNKKLPREPTSLNGTNVTLHGEKKIFMGRGLIQKFISMDTNPNKTKFTSDCRLIAGATIVKQIQSHIYEKTEFLSSSCGVGTNKLMAKLALSSGNRPKGITILSDFGLENFSKTIKVECIPGLKGETGQKVKKKAQEYFGHEDVFMSDLSNLSFPQLLRCLDCGPVIGRKLFRKLSGDCGDEVVEKSMNNSVCSRKQIFYKDSCERRHFFAALRELLNVCEDIADKLCDDSRANGRNVEIFTLTIKTKESSYSHPLKEFKSLEPFDLWSYFREFLQTVHSKKLGRNEYIDSLELRATF